MKCHLAIVKNTVEEEEKSLHKVLVKVTSLEWKVNDVNASGVRMRMIHERRFRAL